MDETVYWIILYGVPLGFLMWCLICIAQGQEYKTDQYILAVAPYSPDARRPTKRIISISCCHTTRSNA